MVSNVLAIVFSDCLSSCYCLTAEHPHNTLYLDLQCQIPAPVLLSAPFVECFLIKTFYAYPRKTLVRYLENEIEQSHQGQQETSQLAEAVSFVKTRLISGDLSIGLLPPQ